MTRTLQERFQTKHQTNQQTGCWEWIGAKLPSGYGMIGLKDSDGKWRPKYAHRVSFSLYREFIPQDYDVCHKCDNPSCVNPEHLFVAPHAENQKDMVLKNRSTKGEKNPRAKLTSYLVDLVKKDFRTQKEIAGDLGVSRGLIGQIKRGVVWS